MDLVWGSLNGARVCAKVGFSDRACGFVWPEQMFFHKVDPDFRCQENTCFEHEVAYCTQVITA